MRAVAPVPLLATFLYRTYYIIGGGKARKYDKKPTRRYHSTVLIHCWSDTWAFSENGTILYYVHGCPLTPMHFRSDFKCPWNVTIPLPPVFVIFIECSSSFDNKLLLELAGTVRVVHRS